MGLVLGLIGCGEIGRLRAAAVARTPGMRLGAVSDVDSARASAIAKEHMAPIDADWRTMLRRKELDAVIVSTPPWLHAEMTIEALQNGKHVICEKPLARDVNECQMMIAAAKESGCFLATGFNYRFYPSVEKARQLLDSGMIGELDHIRSYTGYSAADHNHSWLHDAKAMGGGALRDNGIHLIDLTCYFLGEVADVQGCTSGNVWKFSGCEDNGFALIRGASGRIASLHASWTEWDRYRFLVELYGSRGCIQVSCFPMLTRVVWAPERGGKAKRKTYYFPMVHLMEHLRSYRWVVVESFVREFQEFEQAIHGGKSAVATGVDGLLTIRVAQEAALDRRERKAESVATVY